MADILAKPPRWWPGIRDGHPLARGLVGYWPFWEGSGDKVYDVSRPFDIGNHGTLTDMDPTTDWVGTERGWVLDFDGTNDHILLPNDLFSSLTEWTIGGWVNPSVIADNISPFFGGQGNVTAPMIRYAGAGGSIEGFAGDGSAQFFFVNTPASSLVIGRWNHILIRYDGTAGITGKFFIDGQDVGSGGTVSAGGILAASDTNGIRIGGGQNGSSKAWNGLIADASAWSRALSDGEIQQLYTQPYDLITPRNRSYFYAVGGADDANWYYSAQEQAVA